MTSSWSEGSHFTETTTIGPQVDAPHKSDDDTPLAVAERRRINHSRYRVAIRFAALTTATYLFMNAMAAIIASHGLLADSPTVVIGAMIVALLLGPIVGMALAITDGDWPLFRKSFAALLAGGVVVYGIAASIGWLHPLVPIAGEIHARTAPNSFDLFTELAGGAAGATRPCRPELRRVLWAWQLPLRWCRPRQPRLSS